MPDRIMDYIDGNLKIQPEQQDNMFHGEISLVPEFCAFQGHFPGNPVLPGVVYLMIAQRFIEAVVKEKTVIVSARKNKFFHMLQPPAQLFLKAELKPTGDEYSAKVLFYTESVPRVAVIQLNLQREDTAK